MQDINQQLYEKKETPSEFIPVYSIVLNVDVNINTLPENGGASVFTCDKTINECYKLINQGANIIVKDSSNNIFHLNSITIYNDNNTFGFESTFNYQYNNELNSFTIRYIQIRSGVLQTIVSNKFITEDNIINSYNIQSIMSKVINNGTSQEVLSDINSIFGGFANFKVAISKPNSVFYNDYGKVNVRISNDCIVLFWAAYNVIEHVVINEDGSYIHNTIQIVDQTLYRLSNLNIEPITNPKIWVGTSAQYAAIAEKDVNTTYIVKSE